MALEHWFDRETLPGLRSAVRAEAVAAGMPGNQADDVMLAVHELAANAVRHGGGAGRLRMATAAGELHCHVSDAGPSGGGACSPGGNAVALRQWLIQPGHGLWLVRDIADRLTIAPGPAGSEVSAVFTLPGSPGGHGVR